MKKSIENTIRASLQLAMKNWLTKTQGGGNDGLPLWIGNNMSNLMAEAALLIILSSADAQQYLKHEGMLIDEL